MPADANQDGQNLVLFAYDQMTPEAQSAAYRSIVDHGGAAGERHKDVIIGAIFGGAVVGIVWAVWGRR